MLKTRSLRALAVAVAATAALSLGVGAANATDLPGDYTTAVKLRADSNTSATAYGVGYPGQGNVSHCYKGGTTVGGNSFWDWNTDKATGVTGYSAEFYLTQGYAQPTHC
ncbi:MULTISPECIES: hypothetical protein [Kitasatospora]|uniref:Bacteriocin n=1 Tax=Kitasatospora setae (strain ATCC 33774 / DSM 43861 / JCM 3304 / KCC A-0304 / NBRC 14216 / KM-6054) TaxID=452652 RepID=E4NFZ6_KITSK|nr:MULTISPECIES: hypothetical protein [Kitasatospora]BAJ30426.1 hypothetical protein KSE_46450 [Kitasatospora setae KM-6054]